MGFSFLKNIFNFVPQKNNKAEDHDFTISKIEESQPAKKNYIFISGKTVEVDFDVTWKGLPDKCYKKVKTIRTPKYIVTHWDATLSSDSCFRVLASRGISTHFSIDNDGHIYQLVDCNDISWHAGPTTVDRDLLSKRGVKIPRGVSWNDDSIGIDFSNAYYLKYQDWYKKNVGEERPVITSVCQGSKNTHLGYYPKQIESYKKLVNFLTKFYNIPVEHPNKDKWDEKCATGSFKGVICHYHLTPNKIDCAGLDLESITKSIKGSNNDKK
jgi:hypothetical protein